MGEQIMVAAEFLLETLIVFQGKRPGKVLWPRREVLGENQAGLQGMAYRGQVIEQAPEVEQVFLAGGIAQRWISLA